MDEQATTSRQIIDHRAIASHGGLAILGILVGVLFGGTVPTPPPANDPDHDLVQIVSTALDRGQDYWAAHLDPSRWHSAHVVLVDGDRVPAEKTACGPATRDAGPFYCPASERIFVDLSFLRAIPGDLARAYVIAHELGHHVQKIKRELAGRPSVDVELQADCYAGMWMRDEQLGAHLAPGDIEAALAEASRIGDDRLAPGSQPETWTHGSASQRAAKLREGIEGGPCSL